MILIAIKLNLTVNYPIRSNEIKPHQNTHKAYITYCGSLFSGLSGCERAEVDGHASDSPVSGLLPLLALWERNSLPIHFNVKQGHTNLPLVMNWPASFAFLEVSNGWSFDTRKCEALQRPASLRGCGIDLTFSKYWLFIFLFHNWMAK